MKEFVKVKISRVENVILFKILEQDENVINRGEFKIDIGNVEVSSVGSPQIYTDGMGKLARICLRGNNNRYDNTIIIKTFNTRERADGLCKEIRDAINKLNEELNRELNEKVDTEEIFEIINY